MKFVKAMLFILAALIMAVTLFFVPESSGPVSVSFTTVLGLYLGIDIAGMIAKSSMMPAGEYSKLHTYKYIIAAVCLIGLIIESVFLKDTYNVSTAMTSFIASTMIIIGFLVGGFEGNKIAARNDGEGIENPGVTEEVTEEKNV